MHRMDDTNKRLFQSVRFIPMYSTDYGSGYGYSSGYLTLLAVQKTPTKPKVGNSCVVSHHEGCVCRRARSNCFYLLATV